MDQQDLAALAAKLERVRADRLRLESKVHQLRLKIADSRRIEIELANQIHEAKISSTDHIAPSAKLPTRRSLAVWKAWAALNRALTEASDRAGLPQHAAQKAIELALPGTPSSTIRSYLYRFKKQGLIQFSSGHWHLKATSADTAAQEVEYTDG